MEDIIIILGIAFNLNLPLLTAWLLDHWLGDPAWLPHPVVAFGKAISFCEHRLNKGNARFLKGAAMSLLLVAGAYLSALLLLRWAASYSPGLLLTLQVLLIFYCLAGTTLVREVCEVFKAVDRSLEEGRKQVARIVGRDTSGLSAQEVRTAALETLAENLSDGVIAPLFWYALLGVPGMFAYKSILALTKFMQTKDETDSLRYLVDFCHNGSTTIFVLFALVVGAAVPVFIFHRQSFTATRLLKKLVKKG